MNLRFKVGDNVVNTSSRGLTLIRVQNLTQIRPILVEISDKVLVIYHTTSFTLVGDPMGSGGSLVYPSDFEG